MKTTEKKNWTCKGIHISRWTKGIIFFFFFSDLSATRRDHVAGRTRLINPKGCRSPGNNNETPFMHAWIPPFPPPRPATTTAILLPSRSIHVSFFTFTCCYSKISCPNRHLGSTLPTSLSSFNSTAADGLFSLESSYPSSAVSSDSPSSTSPSLSSLSGARGRLPSHLLLLLVFAAFISPALGLLLLLPLLLLRGCLLGATACLRTHAQDFFEKIQLRRSFMGVHSLAYSWSAETRSLRICDTHIPFPRGECVCSVGLALACN